MSWKDKLVRVARRYGPATKKDLDELRVFIANKLSELTIKQYMNQQELKVELDKLTNQSKKIAAEQSARYDDLVDKIKALEDAIANGEVRDDVKVAFDELKTSQQALDDVIPDAPLPG